ncbi:ABC transporter substrate-binding protein [Pseudochelatococcus sp. B33]
MTTTLFKRIMLALSLTLAAAPAVAADRISVGVTNAASDIALFIADAKGYFAEEGIEVDFVPFDSAAKMIAPLGAGQLDVGGGAASAGFYNALGRDVDVRIVADKARNSPGYGFQSFLVRKALKDSGEVNSLADLKGRKVAVVSNGSSDLSVLNEALKSAGLQYGDVEISYLGFTQQLAAYENGAIDASITTEPNVTNIVSRGAAAVLVSNDSFYPDQQTAVIFYGREMLDPDSDRGLRFMKAYVRAANFYVDALSEGGLRGRNAEEVIDIMAKYSNVKDPDVIRKVTPHRMNPDGTVNMESLQKDLAFFQQAGLVSADATLEGVIDTSYVARANEALAAEGKQ